MADTGTESHSHIQMLDRLIKLSFEKLEENIKENAKIGDFIKMVDLRRKIAPHESEQEQFWQMIEDIRRNALPAEREPANPEDSEGTSGEDGPDE